MAYTIIGWLLIQVMELAAESFEAPVWVMKMLITIVMLGFLPVLLFSWAYEITPEGIKHERDVIRDESIAHLTARKLDYLTLVAVLCVVVLIVWQTFGATTATPAIDTTRDATGTARLGSHSIAVLPFANRSNSDDDLFFTDGIHDDLLTQLSKISDLKVTSRTSVMEYRNTTKKVAQIAAELGVATVLEGSVQRAGHRIRINAQLIEVETDTHLWAETFDREMTIENLFDIQSEITRQIATAVKGHLTPEESSSSATAPTQNIAAYEAYLRARDVLKGDYTVEQYMTAQPMVEKAIVLDPEFALAYLLLAEIHGQAAWIGYDDTTQRRQAAYMALNKADGLLGPQSPELLAARGEYLYRFEQDYPAALKVQIKALAAMPGNALILEQIGLTQRRLGMWEESVDSFLRGAELDPANVSLVSLTADTLLAMQQWSRMKSVLTPARERFADDVDLAATEVLLSLRSEGDVKTARQQFNKIPPNSGEIYFLIATELPWFERDITAVINAWNQPEVVRYAANSGWAGFRELMLAMAYLHLQKSEQAGQLLDEVIRSLMDLDRERRSSTVAADLGTLALSGERDRALELLAEIVGVQGGLTRWEMYLDPRWDFFRDDERFNDLIRPHNLDR
ncbi:MAG: hypothetical protein IID57_03675 [Proteobacteria bacterium]|nr:hypothetical protein [Pseudomonadota bacterium]